MEIKLEMEKKRILVSLFDMGRILFSLMDKFQHWVASEDIARAHTIRLSSLTTLKLMPIQHLVKEFLQSIIWLNID